MKKFRISLLWQVLIAIATGIALGQFLPVPVARIFVTFNGLFLLMKMPFLLISPKIVPKIQLIKKGGCFEYHDTSKMLKQNSPAVAYKLLISYKKDPLLPLQGIAI